MGKIFRRGIDFSGGGGSISNPTAASVTFDNTDTGLAATNVQDAVTEVNGKFSNPTASSVTFNNTDTGLNATNVQDAVTEVNGKLHYKEKNTIIKNNGIAITQTSSDEPFICPSDGYITAQSAVGVDNQTVIATTGGVSLATARSNGKFFGSDCAYVRKGMQLIILAKTGSAFFYPFE